MRVFLFALAVGFFAVMAPRGMAADTTPAEPISASRIDKLIKQLGDKDYFVRQHAQEELARAGFDAFDALSAASSDPDLEIASRAKYLLRLMRVEWTMAGDPPDVKRCLDRYESEDYRTRLKRIEQLAALPRGEGVAALCRLVRFERMPRLSKSAALALLGTGTPPSNTIIETVKRSLGNCRRPGAQWLLAWTRIEREPDAVLSQWQGFIVGEQKLAATETSAEIVATLARFRIGQLKKLGKTDEAMAAIKRLVDLEHGDVQSLFELLQWLVEQKAWKAVDDLAKRFARQFATEPALAYGLAVAYQEQGETDRAEATAARGPGLNPGNSSGNCSCTGTLPSDCATRSHSPGRGGNSSTSSRKPATAATASCAVGHKPPCPRCSTTRARTWMPPRCLRAAGRGHRAGKMPPENLAGAQPAAIRSRMNHFYAWHWGTKGDRPNSASTSTRH